MNNDYFVYILANEYNNVLYIGVTNNLERRVNEHRSGMIEGFTKQYHVDKLVYYECCHDVRDAIAREKQLKHWNRQKKDLLEETMNPGWKDLGE